MLPSLSYSVILWTFFAFGKECLTLHLSHGDFVQNKRKLYFFVFFFVLFNNYASLLLLLTLFLYTNISHSVAEIHLLEMIKITILYRYLH